MKVDSPASVRNCEAIGDVLQELVVSGSLVLELASGGGYHASQFAERFPELRWQPSEVSQKALDSLRRRVAEAALPNLLPPVVLDAGASSWLVARAEMVLVVNLTHVVPWEVTLGLLAGAARTLSPGGALVIYGPFTVDGDWVSEGNRAFDASLLRRDPRWGLREATEVVKAAAACGLELERRIPMPANNQSLIFRRQQ